MKIKVIVNPLAGRKTVQPELEKIIGHLLIEGIASEISVLRSIIHSETRSEACALKPNEYDLVIACGGDGTINAVVNGLVESNSNIPLAILPAGTANDFAYSLKLPTEMEKFCAMVEQFNTRYIDLGQANGNYFVNVAAFGLFTSVAYNTPSEEKNSLGKLAYFFQGIRELPNQLLNSIPTEIDSKEKHLKGPVTICIVANTASVGGMRNLMPKAKSNDGLLDVLVARIPDINTAVMFFNTIFNNEGEKLDLRKNRLLTYFQTKHLCCTTTADKPIELDLDGEYFGDLPVEIGVKESAIQLLVPEE